MLTLNISAADKSTAKIERLVHPIARVRLRLDALYWTSEGKSREEVADLCGIHRNSVKNYIKLYNKKGLDALKTFDYKGFTSVLMSHRGTLETYFRAHPPRTAKQARAKVEELTGVNMSIDEVRRFMHKIGMKPLKTGHIPAKADVVKQQTFLDSTLNPLLQKAKQGMCQLFFMDAAHFVLMPFVGICWSFERLFIKAAPGRNRINVLGALNATTLKMETVINTTYVNAQTIAEMLQKLAKTYKNQQIYVVLDNARYQHCNFIKELAEKLNINLVFLPPYSPNLNLIERVWRYIKKDVLSNKYYECANKFHQAIKNAVVDINQCQKAKEDMKSLLTHSFQSFAQNLLP
jgi:transposase